MTFGYFYEKISLAIFDMCKSTAGLKTRLRNTLRHGFIAFPDDILPEGLREEFAEIKAAFAGVHITTDVTYAQDMLDRMKPSEVRLLVDKLICLREAATREYYKRQYRKNCY